MQLIEDCMNSEKCLTAVNGLKQLLASTNCTLYIQLFLKSTMLQVHLLNLFIKIVVSTFKHISTVIQYTLKGKLHFKISLKLGNCV